MQEEFYRQLAVDRFEEITKEIQEYDVTIPVPNVMLVFNKTNTHVIFYGIYFAIFEREKNEDNDVDLRLVSIGKRDNTATIIIDYRYLMNQEVFSKGAEAFFDLITQRVEDYTPDTRYIDSVTDMEGMIENISHVYRETDRMTVH